MWMTSVRVASMFCVGLLALSGAPKGVQPKTGGAPAASTTDSYRTKALIGVDVRNLEGATLGHVDELLIDVREGRLTYAILSFGGVLGFGDKLFPIPWREISIRRDGGETYAVADVSPEFLAAAPGFERDAWPDMSDERISLFESFWPTHRGILVSVDDQWLTMTFASGAGEHRHAVASNATITRDGRPVRLHDLAQGDRLRVTVAQEAGIRVVSRIAAESPAEPKQG